MLLTCLAVWALLPLGCAGAPDSDDASHDSDPAAQSDDSSAEAGDDTGSGDTAETGDTTPPGDAPSISSCEALCWQHQTGDTTWQWVVDCHASDPDDDLANGRSEVRQGASVVSEQLVACSAEGRCTSSFTEAQTGVRCDAATSYTFMVWVSDLEGHESAPFSVQGRQQ
ncbi:MAG: hypothetical protein H6739_11460 [Alphaproteobacteria bacterium]|nr:hypothetical protein [Alphaproteobacteria bacterium]